MYHYPFNRSSIAPRHTPKGEQQEHRSAPEPLRTRSDCLTVVLRFLVGEGSEGHRRDIGGERMGGGRIARYTRDPMVGGFTKIKSELSYAVLVFLFIQAL